MRQGAAAAKKSIRPSEMFTHLIATTEDATECVYDLASKHQSPLARETKITKIRFIYESGKSLFLSCSHSNNTGLGGAEWIELRNQSCVHLQRRIYEIRDEIRFGWPTKYPLTRWFFGREMERMNQLCELKMSWWNYGRGGWHHDHLIPMSCFDLRKLTHLRLCQSLTNLRPAWDINNFRRRNTVTIGDITRFVNGRLALRKHRARRAALLQPPDEPASFSLSDYSPPIFWQNR